MPDAVVHHHSVLWAWLVVLGFVLVVAIVVYIPVYRRSKNNSVDFDVPVGVTERHTVNFFRNAFTGRLRISVDGVPVKNKIEWVVWKLEKQYEVPVGESETHLVTFVKTRKKLAPGLRKQTVVAYVDGNPAGTG